MTELTPESKAAEPIVHEEVRRARAAFLRDFAALLASRATRGRYVCYHNGALAAVANDYPSIIREAVAKGIPEGDSLIFKVVPGADIFERVVAEEGELP